MLTINEILELDLDSNQQIDMLRQLLEENYEELSKDEINIKGQIQGINNKHNGG